MKKNVPTLLFLIITLSSLIYFTLNFTSYMDSDEFLSDNYQVFYYLGLNFEPLKSFITECGLTYLFDPNNIHNSVYIADLDLNQKFVTYTFIFAILIVIVYVEVYLLTRKITKYNIVLTFFITLIFSGLCFITISELSFMKERIFFMFINLLSIFIVMLIIELLKFLKTIYIGIIKIKKRRRIKYKV